MQHNKTRIAKLILKFQICLHSHLPINTNKKQEKSLSTRAPRDA